MPPGDVAERPMGPRDEELMTLAVRYPSYCLGVLPSDLEELRIVNGHTPAAEGVGHRPCAPLSWGPQGMPPAVADMDVSWRCTRGPTVKNVCEASVYSFDIGQFPYTIGNAQLMKELFGDRFEFIGLPAASPTAVPVASLPMECRDFSGTALLARATMRNKAWFSTRWSFCANLWMRSEKLSFCSSIVSVDGDHSAEGTYADLVNFRKLASCRNWVLMDDAGWNSTNSAWQRAKDEGIITQVECFVDMSPRPDYQFMDYPENRS
ncbi:unnamed protein product, partial [Prorocentrum cordatum]